MRRSLVELAPLLVPCLALIACSQTVAVSQRELADANDTGKTLSGNSAEERLLLQQLPQLPSDEERPVGAWHIVAEPAYQAASGRQCRALSIQTTHQHRLACSDGAGWFFVPDVFDSSEGQ